MERWFKQVRCSDEGKPMEGGKPQLSKDTTKRGPVHIEVAHLQIFLNAYVRPLPARGECSRQLSTERPENSPGHHLRKFDHHVTHLDDIS